MFVSKLGTMKEIMVRISGTLQYTQRLVSDKWFTKRSHFNLLQLLRIRVCKGESNRSPCKTMKGDSPRWKFTAEPCGIVMCNLHSMQTSITVIPVAIHSVTITNGLTSALFTHLQNKLDV